MAMLDRYAPALILLAISVGSLACSKVQRVGETSFPPRPADAPVEVFMLPPQRPYVEIARLIVDSPNPFASEDTLIEKLKVKTREVGGDAVVVQQAGWNNAAPMGTSRNSASGVAIHWK